MIIINTTFVVHASVEDAVIRWIRASYIESARSFASAAHSPFIAKVIGHNADDANSYAVHIAFEDMERAEKWHNGVAESLRMIMHKRWGDNALSFCTFLELLDDTD